MDNTANNGSSTNSEDESMKLNWLNERGEVKLTGILIAVAVFSVFLVASTELVNDFFDKKYDGDDTYNSSFNSSRFTNMNPRQSENQDIKQIGIDMSNDLTQVNGSVDSSISDEVTFVQSSRRSLFNTVNIYNIIRSFANILNEELSIPTYWFGLLITIITFIVAVAIIGTIRGSARL